MLKKVYKKKIVALFLCSWVIFASNSAVAMPSKWCMDCASFTANIAKIFDTVCKFFGGENNNNNREYYEESVDLQIRIREHSEVEEYDNDNNINIYRFNNKTLNINIKQINIDLKP